MIPAALASLRPLLRFRKYDYLLTRDWKVHRPVVVVLGYDIVHMRRAWRSLLLRCGGFRCDDDITRRGWVWARGAGD
jgi:hypothetical protein